MTIQHFDLSGLANNFTVPFNEIFSLVFSKYLSSSLLLLESKYPENNSTDTCSSPRLAKKESDYKGSNSSTILARIKKIVLSYIGENSIGFRTQTICSSRSRSDPYLQQQKDTTLECFAKAPKKKPIIPENVKSLILSFVDKNSNENNKQISNLTLHSSMPLVHANYCKKINKIHHFQTETKSKTMIDPAAVTQNSAKELILSLASKIPIGILNEVLRCLNDHDSGKADEKYNYDIKNKNKCQPQVQESQSTIHRRIRHPFTGDHLEPSRERSRGENFEKKSFNSENSMLKTKERIFVTSNLTNARLFRLETNIAFQHDRIFRRERIVSSKENMLSLRKSELKRREILLDSKNKKMLKMQMLMNKMAIHLKKSAANIKTREEKLLKEQIKLENKIKFTDFKILQKSKKQQEEKHAYLSEETPESCKKGMKETCRYPLEVLNNKLNKQPQADKKYYKTDSAKTKGFHSDQKTRSKGGPRSQTNWSTNILRMVSEKNMVPVRDMSAKEELKKGLRYLRKEDDIGMAITHFRLVYYIENSRNGSNHRSLLSPLSHLAGCHKCLNQSEEAIAAFREIVRIKEIILGYKHPDVASTLYNGLGDLCIEYGRHDIAIRYLSEAAHIYRLNGLVEEEESVKYRLAIAKRKILVNSL